MSDNDSDQVDDIWKRIDVDELLKKVDISKWLESLPPLPEIGPVVQEKVAESTSLSTSVLIGGALGATSAVIASLATGSGSHEQDEGSETAAVNSNSHALLIGSTVASVSTAVVEIVRRKWFVAAPPKSLTPAGTVPSDGWGVVFGPAVSAGVATVFFTALLEAAPAVRQAAAHRGDKESADYWNVAKQQLVASGSRVLRALRVAHAKQCDCSYQHLLETHKSHPVKDVATPLVKLCLQLSEAIYDLEDQFMDLLGKDRRCFDHSFGKRRSRIRWAIVEGSNDTIVVVFRGTNSVFDVVVDLALNPVETDYSGGSFSVHSGFDTALRLCDNLWSAIDEAVNSTEGCTKRIVFCGHSLGGAYAKLAALLLLHRLEEEKDKKKNGGCTNQDIAVYTFGAPRVFHLDHYEQAAENTGTPVGPNDTKADDNEENIDDGGPKDTNDSDGEYGSAAASQDVHEETLAKFPSPLLEKLHDRTQNFVLQGDVIPRMLGHQPEEVSRIFALFSASIPVGVQGYVPVGTSHLICEHSDQVITLDSPPAIARALQTILPMVFAPLAVIDHLASNYKVALKI